MIHAGYTQAADVDFTGAGFFLIGEQGWLAGIGPTRYWQDFGGKRKPGETALQTAAREMKEETGIEAGALTTLHTHVTFKNEHVYVIHVARAPDGVAPRPSRELTQSKWMRDFANDFGTETKEAVHRRVLDDEFLTAANAIHGNIARGAEAARRAVHAYATPTPTAAPHQPPHPSQPNARREHQHANAPSADAPERAKSHRRTQRQRRRSHGVPGLCGGDHQAGPRRTEDGRQRRSLRHKREPPRRRRREYFIHPNNHQPNQPRRAYPTRNNSRGPKHATRATAAARHRPQQRDTETAPNSGKHNCNNTNIINNNNNNNDNNNNHNNTAEKTTAKQSPHRRQTQTKSRQHSHDKPRQGSTRASENLDDASSRGSAGL